MAVLTLAGAAQAQQPRAARGLDAAFLYYELAGLPVPWTEIARHYSEYRDSRDEFERNERFAALRPAMERERNEVLRHKVFTLPTGTTVGEYNFTQETFPIGFGSSMFFTFDVDVPGPRFALTFVNGDKLTDWKLPKDKAREVAALLRNNRRIPVEITYMPVSAREDYLNYSRYRIIEARATGLRLLRPDGRGLLGQMSIEGSEGSAEATPRPQQQPPAVGTSSKSLGGKVEDMLRGNVGAAEDCIDRQGATACLNRHRQ